MRSIKDFCTDEREAPRVAEWSKTQSFEMLCDWVGYKPEVCREAIQRMGRLPLRMRKHMYWRLAQEIKGFKHR